jgi:spore germination cell wall hydrolase CwlJ-like protein
MGRSRLAWAGSAVAPWAIALGFLVSITAQAGQELAWAGDPVAQNSRLEPPSALRQAVRAASFRPPDRSGMPGAGEDAPILLANLTLGAPADLAAIPDEIDPKATIKQGRGVFPAIDRTAKGDPFIALRPGFDAHLQRRIGPSGAGAADGSADSRSPVDISSLATAASRPAPQFGDGATPEVPLELALNSSTPTPSDGRLFVAVLRGAAPAQTTVATQFEAGGKPDYAALVDPKDSARQMRCLAEAIYFESRGEPEAGQAAVAQVVLNRVRSGIFPTNICAVVYQDRNRPFACQFSFACEGKSLRIEEPGPWAVATRIAQEVVSGANYNPKVAEAVNYHANYVMPFWAAYLHRVDRIGNHIFYAMKGGLNWAPGALNGRGDLPPAQQASAAPTANPTTGVAR